jgi:hypothetical protein
MVAVYSEVLGFSRQTDRVGSHALLVYLGGKNFLLLHLRTLEVWNLLLPPLDRK